jgi:hypothetical protein
MAYLKAVGWGLKEFHDVIPGAAVDMTRYHKEE